MSRALLEIGTEELPATEVPMALAAIEQHVQEALHRARLAFGALRTFGTPRRLALLVDDVAAAGETVEELALGPAEKAARDAQGQWTRAAEGFARGRGVSVDDIFVTDTPKGRYLAARVVHPGRPAAEVLAEAFAGVFAAIPWKRSMRWGWNEETFSRPVHWIVALLDDAVLPVHFAGVVSGRTSRGHRFMHPGPVEIGHPDGWVEALRQARVMVDQDERRAAVAEGIAALATSEGWSAVPDAALLDEVIHLVEWPVPLMGRFDASLLEIPREVLITSLRTHQRYFVADQPSGELAPAFFFVSNMVVPNPQLVIDGNRRVLLARLEDARFFAREDARRPLAERVADLDRIVHIDRLGSVGDRVRRLEQLTPQVAQALYPDRTELASLCQRAAHLSKADLVTGMVGEFPELQGIMGRRYAAAQGVPEAIAAALEEHYLPRGAGDGCAQTPVGICLALADRLDMLAGCFALGLIPTGSADPYGLRRAAIGLLRTAMDQAVALPLPHLLGQAVGLLRVDGAAVVEPQKVVEQALEFIAGRLRAMLAQDVDTDIADAVVAVGLRDIPSAPRRAAALARMREQADFEALAAAFRRAGGIVRKAPDRDRPAPTGGTLHQRALLVEPAEQALSQALGDVRDGVFRAAGAGAWPEVASLLLGLKPPIDAFFDAVLVNVEDDAVRRNRLALLQDIVSTFEAFADIGRMQATTQP
jgi:glycyl-tRNA synthetase beta chain